MPTPTPWDKRSAEERRARKRRQRGRAGRVTPEELDAIREQRTQEQAAKNEIRRQQTGARAAERHAQQEEERQRRQYLQEQQRQQRQAGIPFQQQRYIPRAMPMPIRLPNGQYAYPQDQGYEYPPGDPNGLMPASPGAMPGPYTGPLGLMRPPGAYPFAGPPPPQEESPLGGLPPKTRDALGLLCALSPSGNPEDGMDALCNFLMCAERGIVPKNHLDPSQLEALAKYFGFESAEDLFKDRKEFRQDPCDPYSDALKRLAGEFLDRARQEPGADGLFSAILEMKGWAERESEACYNSGVTTLAKTSAAPARTAAAAASAKTAAPAPKAAPETNGPKAGSVTVSQQTVYPVTPEIEKTGTKECVAAVNALSPLATTPATNAAISQLTRSLIPNDQNKQDPAAIRTATQTAQTAVKDTPGASAKVTNAVTACTPTT